MLACSVLQKMVGDMSPGFKKLFKPICNFLFRAIFKDFPVVKAGEENDDASKNAKPAKLDAEPFVNYECFADSERLLNIEFDKNERNMVRYKRYEAEAGHMLTVSNKLLGGLQGHM